MNTQEDKKQIKHNRRNSMQSAINYALENYPYKPNQKELVTFEPETKDNFLFHGARQNIVTILSNLLNNAFFALAKSRSKDKQINIRLASGNSSNRIYFEDNGIGISENIKPYIFDEFFSSRNSRIGAGLPACRRAVQALGGSIDCISKVGKLTRFTVTLPACEPE
jgi:two-component system, CAI-1 autoinducer sensor kinase/phosphatase CqsS